MSVRQMTGVEQDQLIEKTYGQLVFVYFNLRTRRWSVKALQGEHKGRVVAHAPEVDVREAEFRVSEAGRQRVLREKRKNVHAGVVGRLYDADRYATGAIKPAQDAVSVGYNPYKGKTFVRNDTSEPVYSARRVALTRRGVWAEFYEPVKGYA